MNVVLKLIILPAMVVCLVVAGLSIYLSPDDLGRCGARPDESTGCQAADAVIAISGGDTAARTAGAIELYRNGWAELLIFSGAALDKSGPSNAEVMRDIAINAGVPEEDIIIDRAAATTRQNAENTAEILASYRVKQAILVTSPYHQRRAVLEFRRAAPAVDFRSRPASDNTWDKLWWLSPYGWFLAFSEIFKIVYFYLGGAY
jgi:uncharacterized SAM-binding protein YcdF (DUF218 family)